jgi:hypothetical protein
MYSLININIQAVLGYLQATEPQHVANYIWLVRNGLQNQQRISDQYKKIYRGFWNIDYRWVTQQYMDNIYFPKLQNCLHANTPPDIGNPALDLYNNRLDFSFATKLAHMVISCLACI